MNMISDYYLAPSILSADFSKLGQQIQALESAGADWIHIDIMDGHFVPNMSMGRLAVEACKRVTNLPIDVHLMVQQPESVVPLFAESGADHITVHIEATTHIHRTLQQIHELDCKAGITLNPGTPIAALAAVLPMVDLVLVMTVNPGFGAQSFLPESLNRIQQIRHQLDQVNPKAVIEVDGGISAQTLPRVLEAGAQSFVAGNAVFNHPDGLAAGVSALRACLPG
jgi:ribulose-phosphate 3-epimerase